MAFKDINLSFADLSVNNRLDKVNSFLKEIDTIVEFEKLRPLLNRNGKGVKNACGAKAYDNVLMFKILLLQKYYNLSDQACSDALYVNLLYIRFVGLSIDGEVPDESTIGRFRNSLIDNNLYDKVFDSVNRQLALKGYIAQEGINAIVDATLIKSPNNKIKNKSKEQKQKDKPQVDKHNEEINQAIEKELTKDKPSSKKIKSLINKREYHSKSLKNEQIDQAQEIDSKDIQSSQTIIERSIDAYDHNNKIDSQIRTGYHASKKEYITGYKEHIVVDEDSGLILQNLTTFANTHESDTIEHFINHTNQKINGFYGDKAYKSQEIDKLLEEHNIQNNICLKEKQNMSQEQKENQRAIEKPKHKIRAKVEHPFATIKNQMKQNSTRFTGLLRNHLNMTLTCIAANLKHLAHKQMREVKVGNK